MEQGEQADNIIVKDEDVINILSSKSKSRSGSRSRRRSHRDCKSPQMSTSKSPEQSSSTSSKRKESGQKKCRRPMVWLRGRRCTKAGIVQQEVVEWYLED
jgi:hypothetical protein